MTGTLRAATFAADVTPPPGHPLCAGWIRPVERVTDPLRALGIVFDAADARYVLCAVDWCELRNRDHDAWRAAIAHAAGCPVSHVAVQCVHLHNAPLTDASAQDLFSAHPEIPPLSQEPWCTEAAARVADAVAACIPRSAPLTHVTVGSARVDRIASNRRIQGGDGAVRAIRWSACDDPAIRAEPEGVIDPTLRTVGLWDGDRKIAAIHHYATHPMSYYGDGAVTADFVGIARDRRTQADGCPHVYFTGCAGNVVAGKYNDGSVPVRSELADRLHAAMVQSEADAARAPIDRLGWDVEPVRLPARDDMTAAELAARIADADATPHARQNAAMQLAYRIRAEAGSAIDVACVRFGGAAAMLCLPGEPFIEYQLLAQRLAPDTAIMVAGYGDCGVGYVPLERSYAEGGYEPTASMVAPRSEHVLVAAMRRLIAH